MRSFTEHGVVGWIFDEKTHPYGNENPANQKKEEPKKVEKVYDPLDTNHDGKVSASEKRKK